MKFLLFSVSLKLSIAACCGDESFKCLSIDYNRSLCFPFSSSFLIALDDLKYEFSIFICPLSLSFYFFSFLVAVLLLTGISFWPITVGFKVLFWMNYCFLYWVFLSILWICLFLKSIDLKFIVKLKIITKINFIEQYSSKSIFPKTNLFYFNH